MIVSGLGSDQSVYPGQYTPPTTGMYPEKSSTPGPMPFVQTPATLPWWQTTCAIDKLEKGKSGWMPFVTQAEKIVSAQEDKCGACRLAEWAKAMLQEPEVQASTRAKQLLQLYQGEMEQKCSGKPPLTTVALYAAGGLAILGGLIYIFKS